MSLRIPERKYTRNISCSEWDSTWVGDSSEAAALSAVGLALHHAGVGALDGPANLWKHGKVNGLFELLSNQERLEFTSTWLPALKWTWNAISSSTLDHSAASYSFRTAGLLDSSSGVGNSLIN